MIFQNSIYMGLGNKPPRKKKHFKFVRDNLFGCDRFISSPMAREALPNAANAQLVKSQVGVYFLSKIKWFFSVGFSETKFIFGVQQLDRQCSFLHNVPSRQMTYNVSS